MTGSRTSEKPILFLDVDGVVNACPPLPGVPTIDKLGFPICIPPGTPERIARLLEVFEPIWCTSWRGDAHPQFWEELGLPEESWPHIEFTQWKLSGILNYAGDRRWVWIDDDGFWERRKFGHAETIHNGLIVNPETAIGLADEHVEEALTWAADAD